MKKVGAFFILLVLSGCQVELDHQNKITWNAPETADLLPPARQVLYSSAARTGVPAPTPNLNLRDRLHRGQLLYERTCSVCHGLDGTGLGIAIRHGGSPPPTLISAKIQTAALAYLTDIIREGKGQMKSQRSQLTEEEQLQVAEYLKALNLSQDAKLDELPITLRRKLEELL